MVFHTPRCHSDLVHVHGLECVESAVSFNVVLKLSLFLVIYHIL